MGQRGGASVEHRCECDEERLTSSRIELERPDAAPLLDASDIALPVADVAPPAAIAAPPLATTVLAMVAATEVVTEAATEVAMAVVVTVKTASGSADGGANGGADGGAGGVSQAAIQLLSPAAELRPHEAQPAKQGLSAAPPQGRQAPCTPWNKSQKKVAAQGRT